MNVKCAVEVTAGIVLGVAMDEYRKQFLVTSADWEKDAAGSLIEAVGKGQTHGTYLMMQPDRVNWVRVDWVWF